MRSFAVKSVLVVAVLASGVFGEFPTDARAQASPGAAPTLIPVSGELRTADGQPRTGTAVLVLSLYEGQTDAAPRWVEQQTVTLDAAGRYSVQFGATQQDGLPADLFTAAASTRWVGVAVQGEAEQPRVMLISVPYAAKAASADTLAGKPASDFVLTSTFRDDLRTALQEEGVAPSTLAADDIEPLQVINEDLTVNGRLSVTGFGVHEFTGGGTGSNALRIYNTSSGASNYSAIQMGNDVSGTVGGLYAFSSNYTSSGPYVANGFTFDGGSAGGLSIAASHSQGALRFYAGSNNVGMRLDNPGRLSVYGFGNHSFESAGNGANMLSIRNVDNGSGNYSAFRLGNDQAPNVGAMYAFASNYASSGPYLANGFTFDGGSSGGLSIAASHSAGAIRFYAGSNNERMRIANDGRIGIGTSNPQALLHVAGAARVAGDMTVDGNIAAKYQDVAEWVEASEPLVPGTVVVVDPERDNVVTRSKKAYASSVVGAVSPQPGLILGEAGPNKVLVAQSGRVRVKVDARYGAIKRGDLLVTSPRAGYAMKSKPVRVGEAVVHRPGTVLGKALESMPKGEGEILVLITLQ
jgi:hypothetical protein